MICTCDPNQKQGCTECRPVCGYPKGGFTPGADGRLVPICIGDKGHSGDHTYAPTGARHICFPGCADHGNYVIPERERQRSEVKPNAAQSQKSAAIEQARPQPPAHEHPEACPVCDSPYCEHSEAEQNLIKKAWEAGYATRAVAVPEPAQNRVTMSYCPTHKTIRTLETETYWHCDKCVPEPAAQQLKCPSCGSEFINCSSCGSEKIRQAEPAPTPIRRLPTVQHPGGGITPIESAIAAVKQQSGSGWRYAECILSQWKAEASK